MTDEAIRNAIIEYAFLEPGEPAFVELEAGVIACIEDYESGAPRLRDRTSYEQARSRLGCVPGGDLRLQKAYDAPGPNIRDELADCGATDVSPYLVRLDGMASHVERQTSGPALGRQRPPETARDITIDNLAMCFSRHAAGETELGGDYPRLLELFLRDVLSAMGLVAPADLLRLVSPGAAHTSSVDGDVAERHLTRSTSIGPPANWSSSAPD